MAMQRFLHLIFWVWVVLWLPFSCTFDAAGLPGSHSRLCGNGQLDPGEPCDGELFSSTCRQEGYVSGFLLCRPDCSMDVSRCVAGCGECVPGSRRCLDNRIFTCTEYGDGCGMWTQETDCSATREWCREEEDDVSCRAACVNQCDEGQRVCTASGKIEGCAEVMATDFQVCRIWKTLAVCSQGCEELPEPRCADPCVDACEAGVERCSVDRTRREVCREGYSGCLTWMEIFPYCVSGREICETFDNLTLCGCHLCEAGERRCSADLTKVLSCVEDENSCTNWSTQMDCDLLGMTFNRCSETEGYACIPYGDTCSAALPIDPSPKFEASTDHFENYFTDRVSFADPTCGTSLSGAPEAFASLHVGRGETLRLLQENADGPSVRWRVQEDCGGDKPCVAFADRTLVYTSFSDRTIIVSAEVDWNSAHTDNGVNLVIERIPNGCTDAETEPNDGFATANALSAQAQESWGFCSALTPPNPGVSDVDCFSFTLPSPGRRIEVRASALDGSDTCPADLRLRMHRADGTSIATSSVPAVSPECARIAPDETQMEPLVALAPGTYRICVFRDPGQPAADVITRLTLSPPPATPITAGFYNCLPSGWSIDPADAWLCDTSGRFMYASAAGNQTGVFSLYSAPADLNGYHYGILQLSLLFTTNNPNSAFRVVYSVDNFATLNMLAEYRASTSGRQILYLPVSAVAGAGNAVRLGFQLDIESAGPSSSTRVEIDDINLYVW